MLSPEVQELGDEAIGAFNEPFFKMLLEYDRVYGAFWDTVIDRDGKAAVGRSARRYLRAIGQEGPDQGKQ